MSPVPFHKEWLIIDSSKLSDYLACPRKYFYLHVLGWHSDVPDHDLIFGQAWHAAREHQLLYGYDSVSEAFDKFLSIYQPHFPSSTDEMYRPKNPESALKGLLVLARQYKSDLEENEVVSLDDQKMTEISGTVPISEKRSIHYKMDSIMRRKSDGKIFSWDHKTTHENYLNSSRWGDQFFLGIQNGAYSHCLYCLFDPSEVLGVEFYGAGFGYLKRASSKSPAGPRVSFRKVPAFKTLDQMSAWLFTVNATIDDIERDMDRLHHSKDSDLVLEAFPMNPVGCTMYRGCEFHDYCLAWQNPLQHSSSPPLGFHIEFWNPAEVETRVKKDIEYNL